MVEKANHVAAQRFWRNLADDVTPEQAQVLLDSWCTRRGDARMRVTTDGKATVATLAATEPLRPAPPTPFPATVTVERKASAQALVPYRGNFYSVPPELALATVTVSVRLGSGFADIATLPAPITGRPGVPTVLARHALAPDGAGVMVRDHGHVIALEAAALAAATPAVPHRSKQRIPPGPAARAAADALRAAAAGTPAGSPATTSPGTTSGHTTPTTADGQEVVIDLARYAAAAKNRNTLT